MVALMSTEQTTEQTTESMTSSTTAGTGAGGVEAIRYTVTAERGSDPGVWVFQCREHPGAISQSRRLSDAAQLMAEAIGFVAEVDPATVQIDLIPVLPGALGDEVRQARAAVADFEQRQRAIAEVSRQVARRLREAGLSGADTAAVLGVSPQRVSQLVSKRAER